MVCEPVHGDVRGWTGEDLHFEKQVGRHLTPHAHATCTLAMAMHVHMNTRQGDDVYAVWGAGGDNVDDSHTGAGSAAPEAQRGNQGVLCGRGRGLDDHVSRVPDDAASAHERRSCLRRLLLFSRRSCCC